ncbi:probable Peptidyl-prolyl cis-trans isomerase ESS1 [Zygosaccharomyces bailii]|nr:probable Peptidyl-prolyl cis-trans isomerase ESS1 [Zygosaccharomyces bailii]
MSTNGLPQPWTVRYSKTKKREYFFNPETKQSIWEEPEGTDHTALKTHLAEHPVRVRAQHILLKHSESRRPASHRSEHITLPKEQAVKELEQLKQRLVTENFESLAKERSDCNSFKRGGDLGFFGKGEMQPSFEKAAFQLKVGEVSDIVESDSGVHLIKRIG